MFWAGTAGTDFTPVALRCLEALASFARAYDERYYPEAANQPLDSDRCLEGGHGPLPGMGAGVWGGDGGNRTHDEGFADPCLATWPRRRAIVKQYSKRSRAAPDPGGQPRVTRRTRVSTTADAATTAAQAGCALDVAPIFVRYTRNSRAVRRVRRGSGGRRRRAGGGEVLGAPRTRR